MCQIALRSQRNTAIKTDDFPIVDKSAVLRSLRYILACLNLCIRRLCQIAICRCHLYIHSCIKSGTSRLCQIALCFQINIFLCFDIPVGSKGAVCRSQIHIFACIKSCTRCLCQIALCFQFNIACSGEISAIGQSAEIFNRDIPCHIPFDSHSQRIGIILNAHIPGNSLAGLGLDAVHDDAIELIICFFQQQRFAVEGVNRIGSNCSLGRLSDVSIDSFQGQRPLRICLIARCYRTIQRQAVLGIKRYIAARVDGSGRFHNISSAVLFFFPSHGQGTVACCGELSGSIDRSKNQGSVLDAMRNTPHTPYIGIMRCDVYRSAVIQYADRIGVLAHNAGIFIRFEF